MTTQMAPMTTNTSVTIPGEPSLLVTRAGGIFNVWKVALPIRRNWPAQTKQNIPITSSAELIMFIGSPILSWPRVVLDRHYTQKAPLATPQ